VNESIWPYDISRFDVEPPESVYAAAASHKAVEYARVPQTLGDIKQVLASGYPIVFGITVYESFESPDVARTGHVPMPSKKERVLGGHALLIVGFKDDTSEFIVRNSWSAAFGDAGYIYLPYAYVASKDLAQDFWVVRRVSGAGAGAGAGWLGQSPAPTPSFLEILTGLRQSAALYI
jgi:C1A family cysteine protease